MRSLVFTKNNKYLHKIYKSTLKKVNLSEDTIQDLDKIGKKKNFKLCNNRSSIYSKYKLTN